MLLFFFWTPSPDPACGGVFEFVDVRARLRATVRDWNDVSHHVLELLGMVVTALVFFTQSDTRPSYARHTVLMRGHNMSSVQWVSKCRGG